MAAEIQTFLLAMTPIGELRIAIPTALTIYHLGWAESYLISVFGNLIPVIFLLLFLESLSGWLSKNFRIFQRFFVWLFEKTRKKYNSRMEKYGYPALVIFVAIPLPVTGGWTAALIAFLFGISFRKAFPLIALGIMIAGGVVLGLTQTGIAIEKHLGWQILVGILAVIGFGWIIYNKIKIKKI